MVNTITVYSTGAVITPDLVLGYETARSSRNIVHQIIGGGIAVSVIAPNPRSGVLSLFFSSETSAFAALNQHATETTFSLVSTDRTPINMTYVVDGDVSLALEDGTRNLWIVDVGYQEVIP